MSEKKRYAVLATTWNTYLDNNYTCLDVSEDINNDGYYAAHVEGLLDIEDELLVLESTDIPIRGMASGGRCGGVCYWRIIDE